MRYLPKFPDLLILECVILISLGCEAPTEVNDQSYDVRLSWTPPTTNKNETPLTDVRGYRVYVDTTSLAKSTSQAIEVGDDTTFSITDLEAGRYFFAVTAMDEGMNESKFSNIVSISLGGE